MRHLRDSTLLAWLLIVVGLLAALGVAKVVGTGKSMPVPGDNSTAAVVAAKSSDSKVAIEKLRGLAPYGIAARQDHAAVSTWGEQIAGAASEGRAVRTGEGATSSDQLVATFDSIITHGRQLKTAVGDHVAVQAIRTRILLLIDRAHYLGRGMPVPDILPAVATDLFDTNGQTITPPTPGVRPAPTVTPAVPPSPTPSLDLSKPTPGDLQ